MSSFWIGVTFVGLTFCTIIALASHPLSAWRIASIVAGVALYSAWYWFGYGWPIGRGTQWQPQSNRHIVYWCGLALCTLVLLWIDPNYIYMLWALVGAAVGLVAMPWTIILAAPPMLGLLYSWGVWPSGTNLQSWLVFGATLFGFLIYGTVIYMPTILIRQRFAQARLYHDLEIAHQELAAAHAQLAQSAEHARELAVLRERERLAREMHDTLGHALVLASVKIEAVRRLAPVDRERADAQLLSTQEVVRGAMHELRATLAALRSPSLQQNSVVAALARHTHLVAERAGWQVVYRLCETSAAWPEAVQTALLRVGTEAINNAERHAHAQHVTVTVMGEADTACLEIADDGVGLPDLPTDAAGHPTSPQGHFGLAGMRERVADLAGTLCITSAPNMGTRITMRLPLATEPETVSAITSTIH